MGPIKFEKQFTKLLDAFDETKIFFTHDGGSTIVKYIDGSQLLGVKMYRGDYWINRWLGHFNNYLFTGKFDTNAYWKRYTSVRDDDNKIVSTDLPGVTAIPMKLHKKIWIEHSPEHNKFMKAERKEHGDMGFKVVSRPNS